METCVCQSISLREVFESRLTRSRNDANVRLGILDKYTAIKKNNI